MKRKDLIKILNNNGCILLRNGSKHDIYHNPQKGTTQPVPRQLWGQNVAAIARDKIRKIGVLEFYDSFVKRRT